MNEQDYYEQQNEQYGEPDIADELDSIAEAGRALYGGGHIMEDTALVAAPSFDLASFQPDMRAFGSKQLARRAASYERAEYFKATLTQVAMGNTAALSKVADKISQTVPSAERSVRALVDAYAFSSAAKIGRW